MIETPQNSRAIETCVAACKTLLWVSISEVFILPLAMGRLPQGYTNDVWGPKRWFVQGRYVYDLFSFRYDGHEIVLFSSIINIFVFTFILYFPLRLGLALFAARPHFRFKVAYVSIFSIMVALFDMSEGFEKTKDLYSVSTLKPLALDEVIILTFYLVLIVFAAELVAQTIGLVRLQYADRWSV